MVDVVDLDAVTNLATGVAYAFVGTKLSRRTGFSPAAARAWSFFTVWWYALSATGFLAAAFDLAVASGSTDVELFATIQYALIVTFAVAMACLVYYVFYLWTGREWILWPILAVYAYYALRFFYEVSSAHPRGVLMNGWRPVLEYERPITDGFITLSFVFIFLPQTVAALTYLALVARAQDVAQRRRISLVAGAILALSAGAVFIARPPVASDALQAGARVVVILSAFAIYAAYRPPASWSRRFGFRAMDPVARAASATEASLRRSRRLEAMQQRARDLL